MPEYTAFRIRLVRSQGLIRDDHLPRLITKSHGEDGYYRCLTEHEPDGHRIELAQGLPDAP